MRQELFLDWKFIMQKIILLVTLLGLCHCQTLQYSIFEEGEPHQVVGNVKRDSELDPEVTSDYLFSLRYFSGNYQLFSIDSESGIIKTSQTINREEICPYTNPCVIQLDITVRPVSDLKIIKIEIEILDVNDNAPTFPQKKVTLPISEEIMPGMTFPLPAAEDPDAEENGIQSYTIESLYGPINNHFGVQMARNPDGTKDVSLEVLTRLDREEQSAFSFILTATDNGHPKRSGSMTVEINISDSNDNSPAFAQPTYEVEVDENIPIGSTITTVYADDRDSGRNGQVVYGFSPHTTSQAGKTFGINETSGIIYVKGVIDYEKENIYQLTVTASDLGPNTRTAYSKVVITVKDMNDHEPDISINTLTKSGFAEVSENEANGVFVAHLSVTDPDQGDAGQIRCEIDEAHQSLFELQEISKSFEFKVVTKVSFDREELDTFHFQVTCLDQGFPSLSSVREITLHIIDKNDHDPVFLQEQYYATLQENKTANAFVTKLLASDTDIGPNGQISYSLEAVNSQFDSLVRIDPISGVITTNTVFDFEQQTNYVYIVTATDHGNPSKTAVALLNITIVDINDEAPEFNQTSYTFTIRENQPSGATVGHISARDRDGDPFNKVSYFIDASSHGHQDFEVTDSGEIYTRHSLDREAVSGYNLVLVAHNEGYINTNSKVNVEVRVDDENDNPPRIWFPNPANKTVTVSGQTPVGHIITKINATDADTASNGKLFFSISMGNEDSKLGIDNSTGVIYIMASLAGIDRRIYKLLVNVKDGGNPPEEAETTLDIVVDKKVLFVSTNPNQNSPNQNPHNSSLTNIDNIMLPLGIVVSIIILLMVIILSILIIRHRNTSRRRRQRIPKSHKYNCRLEANKTLINGPPIKSDESHTFYKDDYMKGGREGDVGGFGGGTVEDCKQQGGGGQQQMMMDFHHQDHCPMRGGGGTGGGVMPFLESELRHAQTKMPDVVNLSHTEVDSECSGADSGKGTSEEGDWSQSTHSSPNSDILDLQDNENKTSTDTYRVPPNGRPADQRYINNKNSSAPKAAKQLYTTTSSPVSDIDIHNAKNKSMYQHNYSPLTTFSSLPHSLEVQQTNLDHTALPHKQNTWGGQADTFGNIDNGKGQYQALRNPASQKGNAGNVCRDYISSHNKGGSPFEEQLVYFPAGNNPTENCYTSPGRIGKQVMQPGNQSHPPESWIGREGSIRAKQDGRRHLFGNHPFSDEPLHEDDKNLTLNGQKSAFRAIGSQNNTLNSKKKEVRFADKCVELNGRWHKDDDMVSSVDGLSEDGASITSGSYILDSHNVLTGDTFV